MKSLWMTIWHRLQPTTWLTLHSLHCLFFQTVYNSVVVVAITIIIFIVSMILRTSVWSQPRAHIVSTILCNPHTEVKWGGGVTVFCCMVLCHLYDLQYGCCVSTLIIKNCIIIIIIINQCYNGYSSLAVIFYWLFRNHVQMLELGVKSGRKEWVHVKLKPLADGKFVLRGNDPQECGVSSISLLNNLAPYIGDNGFKPFPAGKFNVQRCEVFFLVHIPKKFGPIYVGKWVSGLK